VSRKKGVVRALLIVAAAAVALGAIIVALQPRASAPGSVPALPIVGGGGATMSPRPTGALGAGVRLFAPGASDDAARQIADLRSHGDVGDAGLVEKMASTPTAIWLTGGTPNQVGDRVASIVTSARDRHEIPVLVAYDVPGRDCSQYSAGGAATGDAYRAWIAAIADGLGSADAIVVLEPDGIALLPSDCGQPDPYNRLDLIHDAARALRADPNAKIYLDAGHAAWHPVGEIAGRLARAGVGDVDGFVLNVSNYQPTDRSVAVGHWIARCVQYGTITHPGDFGSCPSQYDSDPNDPATWHITDVHYDDIAGSVPPDKLPHFVIDTSRNGRGPWSPPAGSNGDQQDWCNPPGRGLGPRPTTATGDPLVDAYLWIKVPGESDGQCLRGTGGPADPARGTPDPPAGTWFPEMALELARNAEPPL
jgi:endoglucanase